MSNKDRSKKSKEMARTKTLAYCRNDDPGILPYCKKCPAIENCENVLWSAKGVGYVFCADNPKEKRLVINSSKAGITGREMAEGIYRTFEALNKILPTTREAFENLHIALKKVRDNEEIEA